MRPILRPGLHRVHGSAGEAVVAPGGSGRATLRPLDPTEYRLLDAADGVRDHHDVLAQVPEDRDAAAALARLVTDHIVVDLDAALALIASLPADRRRDAQPEVAAVLATDGTDGLGSTERLERRRRARVTVVGGGPLADRLAGALTASLLGDVRRASLPPESTAGTLVVLTGTGEPPVQLVERLTRDDQAHLVAALHGAAGVVGPWVVPGLTPCLRCLDLTRCDLDPGWALQRLALDADARSSTGGGGILPAPAATVVVDLVVALAAADVVAWAEGRAPSTLGATVDVVPLATVEGESALPWRRRMWPRHPECGCGWHTSATMDA